MKTFWKNNKRIISIFLLIASLAFSDSQIDKNTKRISEIDKQVSQNKTKINNNNTKINSAKRTEASIQAEIAQLNKNIRKLQSEYDVLEKKYKDLLKLIGKNETEIRKSIKKIEESTEEIKINKEEYSRKLKNFDSIRRTSGINKKISENAERDRRNYDIKRILDSQNLKISGIEQFRESVKKDKDKVEIIKQKNQTEAQKINDARKELENKKKELNHAKAKQNSKVAELKALQRALSNENKKIEKTNINLINERARLEAQIREIIRRSQQPKVSTDKGSLTILKGTGALAYPMKNGRIVVAYGQEKVPGLKSKGIEIEGTLGQTITAADTGTVIFAGSLSGLGKVVIINHGDLVTVYGNLATVRVSRNSNVKKGQSIGTLGKDSETKRATLYFEVRKGVNIVNPASYL